LIIEEEACGISHEYNGSAIILIVKPMEAAMAQILVRDLETETVDRLKARARGRGRSLQAEVKSILEQAAKLDVAEARALAAGIRRRLGRKRFEDSARSIREDRGR
jgi:plasmid stability protein